MMTADQHGNEVELQQRAAQPVISIRATIPTLRLGEVMGARIAALTGYLRASGAQVTGPFFVRYHTFSEIETDMETGFPLVEPVPGEGEIVAGELPGGPAIATWHHGPHDRSLGEAYARLAAWQQEHARESDGPLWEVYYWIDPRQESDPTGPEPASGGIQLVQPIK
jgi:effector-binding domain-containing protein